MIERGLDGWRGREYPGVLRAFRGDLQPAAGLVRGTRPTGRPPQPA